jgi:hypothetical protein
LQRPHGNAQQLGEAGLRQAGLLSRLRDVRDVDDAADLSALDLAKAAKDLRAEVASMESAMDRERW